jgi:hypothetical protein
MDWSRALQGDQLSLGLWFCLQVYKRVAPNYFVMIEMRPDGVHELKFSNSFRKVKVILIYHSLYCLNIYLRGISCDGSMHDIRRLLCLLGEW